MQQLTENNGLVNKPQRVITHTVIAQQLQGVQGLRDDFADMFTRPEVMFNTSHQGSLPKKKCVNQTLEAPGLAIGG